MTTRINQNPFKHFFGLLRASGRANSSPESGQIAQIFRLLSLYSLIKPPKGSNVSGGSMLEALIIALHCNKDQAMSIKEKFDLELDKALQNDINFGTTVSFRDNEEAFAYVCGSIARRHKLEECANCVETIVGDGIEEFNTFIILRSRGHLTFPSNQLITLLQEVESLIAKTLHQEIKRNTLLEVIQIIGEHGLTSFVGCDEHKIEITKKIVFSFIMLRLTFSCQREARKRAADSSKPKKLAKLSRLV